MPIKILKPIGLTPLELIEQYKNDNNVEQKMSFAGRLDPMASGLMLLLVGDECKKQPEYCGKDKIYEFKILYGFETDSLDILGISKKIDTTYFNYKDLIGSIEQKYPVYSSKTLKIDGKNKPLWYWEKKGILKDSMVPKKNVKVFDLNILERREYSNLEIRDMIIERISKLSEKNKDKFRYTPIRECWEEKLLDSGNYKVDYFRAKVSSGTYIRGLCQKMGGVAFDINRIDIIF
jgi:tRNA pseudouridine(55) synthase